MSDFLCFIRNPVHTRSLIRLPVKEYLKLLFFYFLWAIPFGVLAAVVSDLLGMTSKVGQIAFPRQIYYGIIIAPIVEETFFRLMYIFNRRNLIILSIASLLMAVFFMVNGNMLMTIAFCSLVFLTGLLLFFSKAVRFISTSISVFSFFNCHSLYFDTPRKFPGDGIP